MNFSSEFYTTEDGRHRVEISVRDGYPTPYERKICDRMAEYLVNRYGWETGGRTQIIAVFNDDTHGVVSIHLATDDPEDIEPDAEEFWTRYWGGRMIVVDWQVVERGNTESDHYNHAEYLRRMVDLKHRDRQEYERQVAILQGRLRPNGPAITSFPLELKDRSE